MKEKTNIKKSSSREKFNIKPAKLKRANSLKPNKIIHIDKFRLPMDDINTEMRDIQKVLKTENSRQIKNKVLIKKTNMKIVYLKRRKKNERNEDDRYCNE